MNAGEVQPLGRITVASDVPRLSDRYAVQFSLREGRLNAEWTSHAPPGIEGQLLRQHGERCNSSPTKRPSLTLRDLLEVLLQRLELDASGVHGAADRASAVARFRLPAVQRHGRSFTTRRVVARQRAGAIRAFECSFRTRGLPTGHVFDRAGMHVATIA